MRRVGFAAFVLSLSGCSSPSDPIPQWQKLRELAPQVRMTMTESGPVYNRPLCPEGSGTFRCLAWVRTDSSGREQFAPSLAAAGFSAAQLQRTYLAGVDLDRDPGITIGIVDAYGYRRVETDLKVYRQQNGLPECTIANGCLKVVNQRGETSPLPRENSQWAGEAALDLDMASAMCPKCKLLMVQTDDSDTGLFEGQVTAARLGAMVISNSYGSKEDKSTPAMEKKLDLPTKPTIFASSGDWGFNGNQGFYPSTSAFVIGVGGTTLRGNSETTWSEGGSACSAMIDKRSYEPQTQHCDKRVSADVSAVGDPATGVSVYFNGGWLSSGGTSASSPILAGVFASTGHAGDQASFVYQHPEAFKDVTSGKNGSCGNELCEAGAGWDGPTGLGTPIGSKLAAIPPEGPKPPAGDMGAPGDMASSDMAEPADGGQVDMGGNDSDDMATEPSPDMSSSSPDGGRQDMSSGPGQGGCSVAPGSAAGQSGLGLLLLGLLALGRLRRRV